MRGQAVDGRCLIGWLMVHPRLQRRGLGTQLMYTIEECLRDCDHNELFTGHRSEGNLHLYRRLGYKFLREERISARLRLVYLEKRRSAP